MNKKEYEKIAEIINAYLCKYICKKNSKIENYRQGILTELADYFESKLKIKKNSIHGLSHKAMNLDLNLHTNGCMYCQIKSEVEFNRQQFLKDCGVK